MKRICEFSPCRLYRYTLWREWDLGFRLPTGYELPESQGYVIEGEKPNQTAGGHAFLMVIGLNPSTADETQDDPTIRRCIGFAKRWGFRALCMTNLFAWRDTKPENMKRVESPVGDENDQHLEAIARRAGLILAAWGTHGSHRNRAAYVRAMIGKGGLINREIHCLKQNADGSPMHPLYVPADTVPVRLTD